MKKERGNGAFAVVVNPKREILVARQGYGEGKWMLPGGEIERGESARHAAQEETEEETGIVIDENDLVYIGHFVQRPNGFVFLYETNKFSGQMNTEPTEEIAEVRFMSFEEIVEKEDQFLLAYRRLILRYMRCKLGIDKIPYEGRLSDPVEFPKNLDGGNYRDIVLLV